MNSTIGQVFVSVQRQRDPRQEAFLTGIQQLLRRHRLGWVILDRHADDTPPDPLPHIRDVIASCQGALVIAFERWRSNATVEYPGAPYAIAHGARRLPTVWNQIEAAMAFQAGLPLLVLAQSGVHQQGMTSPRRAAIQVASFTLDTAYQQPDHATCATVEAWCRDLAAHIGAPPPSTEPPSHNAGEG